MVQTTQRRNRAHAVGVNYYVDKMDTSQIADIHRQTGYPGIKMTQYFVSSDDPLALIEVVISVVREYEACCTNALAEREAGGEKKLEQSSDRHHPLWQ